jgi:hypothetical protein
MESVNATLERLKARAATRRQVDVERLTQLNLRWEDQSQTRAKSGYYARIGGNDMRLGDGAVKTLNRLIKGPADLKHWENYSDRNAFCKAAVNILDNPARRSHGVILLHDQHEVNAFLPSSYLVRSAYTMLSEFVEMLTDSNLTNIRGIDSIEYGDGDNCSYRVAMGNNIITDTKEEHGQLMMFMLSMSETGQTNCRTSLGMYRPICTNTGIEVQTLSNWSHRAGSEERFYNATGDNIRLTSYMQNAFSSLFSVLLKTPLEADPIVYLNTMKVVKLITREHWTNAKVWATMPCEDGRKCETHYDLFNALTHGAQELTSLSQREVAEQTSMEMFSTPGGLDAVLRAAAAKVSIGKDVKEDILALN